MKTFIVILLLVIFISLGQSLYYLITDKGTKSKRTVKMLTLRIGLSVGIFMIMIIASFFGVIQPHGVLPDNPPLAQQQSNK